MVLVLVTICVTLAMRIVMLWLLLLFSPAAYALRALPFGGMGKYADMWWKEFLCWSFFTPLMALGLTLVYQISQAQQQYLAAGGNVTFPNPDAATKGAATLAYNVLSIFITLGLLYGFEKAAKGGACSGAGVVVDKVSSYGNQTLKGKGAFSTAGSIGRGVNATRNTIAGGAAGLGASLAAKDSKFLKGLGGALTGTAGVMTYDQTLKEKASKTPVLRLATKEGRIAAKAESDAALKDIREKQLTGVNPSEAYKDATSKKTSEAIAKYTNKTSAQLKDTSSRRTLPRSLSSLKLLHRMASSRA